MSYVQSDPEFESLTLWKINMEPTNHPFRKENDLPNLHDYVPAVNLPGCSSRCFTVSPRLALYTGMMPRMLHAVPSAAMCWGSGHPGRIGMASGNPKWLASTLWLREIIAQ